MLEYDGQERRSRRSDDTMTALHYQLARARFEGEFDALVLADAGGCLVAGVGPWATCEMLAAFAPLVRQRQRRDNPAYPEPVEIRRFMIEDAEILLCARGGGRVSMPSIVRAASGCRRILGGEA